MADDPRIWLAILFVVVVLWAGWRRDIAAAVKLFFDGDSFDPVEEHHMHLVVLSRSERVYNEAKEDELRARLDKAAKSYLDAASL